MTDLFIDEIHHLEHWPTVIKTIYESYPDLRIAYSGSSILRLDNREGDLSRRQLCYELKGMSFREFLAFEGIGEFPVLILDDLLRRHVEIAAEIVRNLKIIPLFEKYQDHGFYPFYREAPSG